MKSKKLLVIIGLSLTLCFSLGAATGMKISAMLMSQKISFNGYEQVKQVISYNNSTYVPLRDFSNLVGIKVNYTNGTIYLGDAVPDSNGSSSSSTSKPAYSKANPAPVGATQTVTVTSDYWKDYTLQITMEEKIRGDKAWKILQENDGIPHALPSDEEYVLVRFKVKAVNTDPNENLIDWSDFTSYSNSGSENPITQATYYDPEDIGDLCVLELYTGETYEGWGTYVVKKSDSNPKLAFEPSGSNAVCWFSLSY